MTKGLASITTLREQVAEILAKEIEGGRFSSQRLPSVRILSERFGVSTLTIIGALNQLEARNLIERVHGKGVFVRDRRGKSRKLGKRTLEVGIFCHNTPKELAADSYYGEIWAGLVEAAAGLNARLTVATVPSDDPVPQVKRTLADTKLDGGVLLAMTQREALLQIQRLDLPFVLADHHYQGLRMDCVTLDSRAGSLAAVRHLVACGYRSIGLLATRRVENNPERLGGFLQGLAEAGLDANRPFIRQDFTDYRGGRHAMASALAADGPIPEAFFVWSGPMVSGALQALRESTRPEARRIKLLAAASPTLKHFHPELAAVVADGRAVGAQALETLARRIAKPETPYAIHRLPMELDPGTDSSE
ncbi:MAG: GntR family transcriptional regulator [Planctomycetota bacterium]|nr:GntR family transcriptional regulator [Planctomycetota bacterium]